MRKKLVITSKGKMVYNYLSLRDALNEFVKYAKIFEQIDAKNNINATVD